MNTKIDISKLRKDVIEASETGLICWKPTGNRVRIDNKVYFGYKTELPNGLSMEIIPNLVGDKMISNLMIRGGMEELLLTEDTEKLSGKEVSDSADLLTIILSINEIFKDKSLVDSIENELTGLLINFG